MSEDEVSVSPISELDRLYKPPPGFADWTPTPAFSEDVLAQYAAALESERQAATPEAFNRIIRTALRAAAVDTGAIEGLYEVDRGFTYTIAAEEAAWEAALDEKGPDAKALIEAQLSAYELILDAATRELEITEAWIRRLHEELCRPQDTYEVRTPQGRRRIRLPKGEYKHFPNHVLQPDGTQHAYGPVNETPSEMHRFVNELRTTEFLASSPVLQSAFAHYFLVAVHPFADGNGRVARALSSVFTYRALSIPLVIYADQRQPYLESLRAADRGNAVPWVRFVADRVLDSIAEATQELRAATGPPIEETLDAIRRLNVGCGGLPHSELDAVAARLLDTTLDLFRQRLEAAIAPPLSFGLQFGGGSATTPAGYRPIVSGTPRILQVLLRSAPPAAANNQIDIQVGISTSPDADFCLVLQGLNRNQPPVEIRLADAHPEITVSLRRRLSSWVDQLIADELDAVRATARMALKAAGYPISDDPE